MSTYQDNAKNYTTYMQILGSRSRSRSFQDTEQKFNHIGMAAKR